MRLLTVPPQSTPSLTHVKLSCSLGDFLQEGPLNQPLMPSPNIFSAPALRSLDIGPRVLVHDILRLPVAWSNLEHLVFLGHRPESSHRFDAVQALELLKECPNLVTCYFVLEKDAAIPTNCAPIPLLRLKTLSLEPYTCSIPKGFASSLILPSLRQLKILVGPSRCSPREDGESGLFEFFQCFGSTLEDVSFCYECLTQAALHHSLRLLPNVTSLGLFCPYKFEYIETQNSLVAASLNRDIFMHLTPQFNAAGTAVTQMPLCPSIEVLTFSGGGRIAEDALFEFIVARRREVNNQPARLRVVAYGLYVFTTANPIEILHERGVDMEAFSLTQWHFS